MLPTRAAFPSLIESTHGGLLANADDPSSLSDCLQQILQDSELRWKLANFGYTGVRERHDLSSLTTATKQLWLDAGVGTKGS